jgi:RNA chaperone Hfq
VVLIPNDPDLVRKDPSVKYLFKQFKIKSELIFICYQEEIRGIIVKILQYSLKVRGIEKFLSKTSILYFFKPDALEAVKQNVTIDEDVVEEKLEPANKKDERLEIPDDILQKCFNEKTVITVTMRNGHVLKGQIHSFGIFSIRLQIDKKYRVIIFRHAIYDLEYRKT